MKGLIWEDERCNHRLLQQSHLVEVFLQWERLSHWKDFQGELLSHLLIGYMKKIGKKGVIKMWEGEVRRACPSTPLFKLQLPWIAPRSTGFLIFNRVLSLGVKWNWWEVSCDNLHPQEQEPSAACFTYFNSSPTPGDQVVLQLSVFVGYSNHRWSTFCEWDSLDKYVHIFDPRLGIWRGLPVSTALHCFIRGLAHLWI